MIQRGTTLEVLVVIDLIPEEEAIVAVAAVVTVKARGEGLYFTYFRFQVVLSLRFIIIILIFQILIFMQ